MSLHVKVRVSPINIGLSLPLGLLFFRSEPPTTLALTSRPGHVVTMSSPSSAAAATPTTSSSPSAAADRPATTSSSSSASSSSLAAFRASLVQEAAYEEFPVFEDDVPESTPSSSSPVSSSRPLSPPAQQHPPLLRRRSRNVTEQDRRIVRGLSKKKVFDYVDLVKSLRSPPAPGKLPKAPAHQSGSEIAYRPANSQDITSFSPAPWALSRSPSPAQRDSSDPPGQTSGSMQQRTANTSQNTT